MDFLSDTISNYLNIILWIPNFVFFLIFFVFFKCCELHLPSGLTHARSDSGNSSEFANRYDIVV